MTNSTFSSTRRRSSRLLAVTVITFATPLALLATGCDDGDVDPTSSVPGVPDGPGIDDDSTTSSLRPGATPPPNPDAGGGGPVPSDP